MTRSAGLPWSWGPDVCLTVLNNRMRWTGLAVCDPDCTTLEAGCICQRDYARPLDLILSLNESLCVLSPRQAVSSLTASHPVIVFVKELTFSWTGKNSSALQSQQAAAEEMDSVPLVLFSFLLLRESWTHHQLQPWENIDLIQETADVWTLQRPRRLKLMIPTYLSCMANVLCWTVGSFFFSTRLCILIRFSPYKIKQHVWFCNNYFLILGAKWLFF